MAERSLETGAAHGSLYQVYYLGQGGDISRATSSIAIRMFKS
jgi:hypothetical protein